MTRCPILLSICLFSFLPVCYPQTLTFTSVPRGYLDGSTPLPRSFAGGLGTNPVDDSLLFVSVGTYLDTQIARIDLETGSATIVAHGPFGNIAGIAVLNATQMVLVDNASAPGGPPDKTILLASDINTDGDFDDEGEITELIAPILTGFFGWSGAQARVAPPGNPCGIPSGSVLIQTADGGGTGEILVITNPLGIPAYRPAGGSFFNGFDYNGGFDFDSQGHLVLGTATVTDPILFTISGRIHSLINGDKDDVIEEGEANIIVDTDQLPSGISDLILDGEDDGFCVSGGTVYTFREPADPLHETTTVSAFATTNSYFLSGIMINSKDLPFDANSGPRGATLVIGGGFGETNLLTLKPTGSADLNEDGMVDANDLMLFQDQWRSVTGP